MKATKKAEGLEQALTALAGADRRETIAKNVCLPPPIGCGKSAKTFRDELSRKEFAISGLCQKCQDGIFEPEPEEKVGLDGDVFIVNKPYSMFSGAAEAAKFVYRKITDKQNHVWLYPVNCDYPAEQVHFHAPEDKNSQGYGGSTLLFNLEDGSVYAAAGPWHTNADSMFQATGVDIRATHRTYGCVARKRVSLPPPKGQNWSHANDRYEGVLYADSEPTLGTFDRLKKIAVEWATKLGHPVACYSSSRGGSSSGWELPKGTEWRQWDSWFKEQR